MTNTIPNVPRELLERLALQRKQAGWLEMNTASAFAAAKELRVLLDAAPSSAGVDGLKRYEVFPYLDDDVAELDICESDDGTFVKYDDAQAIIDGLRGGVADLRSMLATVSKAGLRVRTERDQHAKRIGELASHLEFAVTLLTVAGLAGNAQVEAMRSALSAGKEGE